MMPEHPLITLIFDPMGFSPVFMRDFRSRMRRPWAYWMLLGYAGLLNAGGVYLLFQHAHLPGLAVLDSADRTRQFGLLFALAVFTLQCLLVLALTPVLTCAAFAAERASGQLLFTLLTPLSSRAVVTGKLQGVLFYIGLLLISAMPLAAVSSLFGGLNPIDLLAGFLVLLAFAYLAAAFGLYVSALSADTPRAAAVTYAGLLLTPLLFPWLLAPAVGVVSLLGWHDQILFQRMAEALPIPVIAVPLILVFLLCARWFVTETTLRLDIERRRWGTFAPPLPPPEAPPTATVPAVHPHARRW
jgi:ABC-type transport system involved in multi-copper enzyme maturation permease subunit